MSKTIPVPRTQPTTPIPRTSFREDLGTVTAGAWMVLGLFSDGWAHLTLPAMESFFTPWHAALYSGFLAAAVWVVVLALRRGAHPALVLRAPRKALHLLPAGYPSAALGVVVFGSGGVLDLAWHTAFGIEVGLDALLSPSHLTLFVGGALLLSAPVRAAWRTPDDLPARFGARFPELLSLALTTGLVSFFLMYLSAFARPGVDEAMIRLPEGAVGHEQAQLSAVVTLAAYLTTTGLIAVPLLLLARRTRIPLGATTLLIGTVAWLSAALDGFSRVGLPLAVTVAAVLADLALARLDRIRGFAARGRLPLIGGLVPAVVWSAEFAVVALGTGIRYPVALWTGVLLLSILCGAALGLLAAPTHRRGDSAPGGAERG